MKIFSAFLVIVVAAILFMLPLTEARYDFRTDLREDTFNLETVAAQTTGNVTLSRVLFDNDTDTITIISSISTDIPLFSSYNTTTRFLGMTGFAVSSNRTLTVTYDINALDGSDAINAFIDRIPFAWMLVIIALPIAALFAIFTGRV